MCASLATVVCLLSTVGVSAGQNPFRWMTGGDKDIKYTTYKDPAGRFEIEYPTKDWKIASGGGSSVAGFARSDGASLFIDYSKLADKITPAEIESMGAVEINRLKDQWPKAKDFKSEVLEGKSGTGVLVRYSRPGTGVEDQAAIQYSVPVELSLYRLNGVVPQKLLPKHEAVVMHMIQSFKAAAATSTTGSD
jgi:hypothetical protein